MIKMIRALKFCRFGGKDYYAKDVVPDSAVDKKMIGSLVKMKVIEVTPDEIHLQSKSDKRRRTKSAAL